MTDKLPGMPPPVLSSQKLTRCWVCGISHVPFNEHHIVPRAFGGLHGPTITLCGSHHDLVHNLGLALEKGLTNPLGESKIGSSDLESLQGLSEAGRRRVEYLASVIAQAAKTMKTDSNKTVKYSGKFSARENDILLRLQESLGCSSKHDTLVRCLHIVAGQRFK